MAAVDETMGRVLAWALYFLRACHYLKYLHKYNCCALGYRKVKLIRQFFTTDYALCVLSSVKLQQKIISVREAFKKYLIILDFVQKVPRTTSPYPVLDTCDVSFACERV